MSIITVIVIIIRVVLRRKSINNNNNGNNNKTDQQRMYAGVAPAFVEWTNFSLRSLVCLTDYKGLHSIRNYKGIIWGFKRLL